ncbi:sporulation histidine kinase inhibitor Sda [Paenibacillus sp. GD4]|jgi:developmental checkpoint coupling sporulation initiation to replication initiation|uniref:sporulation histidine kinase inhibitor Sda n=1 Tax=Paenibacillus TaxID=44249 RepID=UPI0025432AC8|nr:MULTISPECIES: sporulation histidine kinase inhibitor Sda [Paenibacillus]MDQ1912121.1 sporulation histidine kinase inhibitor Sda [Paenibacillus sp. GD4]
MKLISNEILVDSYFKAIDLKLEQEFVDLLLEEIKRRQINLDYYNGEAQVS